MILNGGPTASASPGNLLEMESLSPHLRPTESEALGSVGGDGLFNRTAGWFWCKGKFESHWSKLLDWMTSNKNVFRFLFFFKIYL